MKNEEQEPILFFKIDKKHYCKYKNIVSRINEEYIKKLKKQLPPLNPPKAIFKGYSKQEIDQILKYLYGEKTFFKSEEQYYILFFKNGTYNYYKYKDDISIADPFTINNLNAKLLLPCKIEFKGYTEKEIKKIINNFFEDKNVDKKIDIIGKRHYEVNLFERKNKVIGVIEIKNNNMLYGRTNNINPYVIKNIDGKKVLLETPRDQVKNNKNKNKYYFLYKDLGDEEKIFFSSLFTEIEYDLIYKIDSQTTTKGLKKLRKNRL